jgi:hypothetical protein
MGKGYYVEDPDGEFELVRCQRGWLPAVRSLAVWAYGYSAQWQIAARIIDELADAQADDPVNT